MPEEACACGGPKRLCSVHGTVTMPSRNEARPQCMFCEGSGQVCENCYLPEADCECGEFVLDECSQCGGTGVDDGD